MQRCCLFWTVTLRRIFPVCYLLRQLFTVSRIIDLPGQETYFGGITRNNVSVLAHGPSSVSFVVSIGESIVHYFYVIYRSLHQNVPQLCGPCNVDTSSWFCRGHLGGCVGGLVYGTDAYALASNYCSAAQHSGAIDFNAGGKYSLVKLGRVPHFYGSIRNGISSLVSVCLLFPFTSKDAEGSHTGFLCTIPGSQPILPVIFYFFCVVLIFLARNIFSPTTLWNSQW